MEKNMWIESHKFIINMNVGDSYYTGSDLISVVRKTKTRIYLSDGSIIHKKKYPGNPNHFYLSGKRINNILRDVEGFLIYKIHSNNLFVI
jgi:hypothetical protein